MFALIENGRDCARDSFICNSAGSVSWSQSSCGHLRERERERRIWIWFKLQHELLNEPCESPKSVVSRPFEITKRDRLKRHLGLVQLWNHRLEAQSNKLPLFNIFSIAHLTTINNSYSNSAKRERKREVSITTIQISAPSWANILIPAACNLLLVLNAFWLVTKMALFQYTTGRLRLTGVLLAQNTEFRGDNLEANVEMVTRRWARDRICELNCIRFLESSSHFKTFSIVAIVVEIRELILNGFSFIALHFQQFSFLGLLVAK